MDSKKKDIALQAQRLEENRNEKVRKIKEHLNSSQNEPTNKDLIQKVQRRISEDFTTMKEYLDKKFIGLCLVFGIMAYFICCFCGQDEWLFLWLSPLIISKKAFCWTLLKSITLLENIPCEEEIRIWTDSELVVVFQEDESKFNLLFPLAFAALLGILFISAFIFGLVKLMNKQKDQTLFRINQDGNWVYGGKSSKMEVQKDGGTRNIH